MGFPVKFPLARLSSLGVAYPFSITSSSTSSMGISHGGFAVRILSPIIGSEPNPLHPGEYVVAYSSVCTHMGCQLKKELSYQPPSSTRPEELISTPCQCHGSTFDLLRNGLVAFGPATQHLPQLKISIDQDDLQIEGWLTDVSPRHENWPYHPSA